MNTALLTSVLLFCVQGALSSDSRCSGSCQWITRTPCYGEYVYGLCDGPNDRKCCRGDASDYNDSACVNAGGQCMMRVDGGPSCAFIAIWSRGLCGGGTDRLCCRPVIG